MRDIWELVGDRGKMSTSFLLNERTCWKLSAPIDEDLSRMTIKSSFASMDTGGHSARK